MSSFLVGLFRFAIVAGAVIATVRLVIRSRYRRLAKTRVGESLEDFTEYFAGRDVPNEILEVVYRGFGDATGVPDFAVRATDEVGRVYGLVEHFDDFLKGLLKQSRRRAAPEVLATAAAKLNRVEDVVYFISSCPAAA
jgi:hypothetical protein